MVILQTVFKLYSGNEIASETIKGKYLRKCESESCHSCTTHCHDLFYIAVKYHDYISKCIKITERTQKCIKCIKGEIKLFKRGLSFLYASHRHDLFYITVKYHDYILSGFQVIVWTRNCILNHQREITQKV